MYVYILYLFINVTKKIIYELDQIYYPNSTSILVSSLLEGLEKRKVNRSNYFRRIQYKFSKLDFFIILFYFTMNL